MHNSRKSKFSNENMWKHLLQENITYIKKYETYESKNFQDKNFALDSYFCSKVEPSSVTVNDLADMQLKADDVSPDIWHPFLPNISIDSAPYITDWNRLQFFTANKEIMTNLLLVKDYTTVAKILYAVFKRVNQYPVINTDIVKQMNPDLLFILLWNQSVLVRFMTVRLVRLLLGDEEMLNNLFYAKIYVGLWEVFKEEIDPILLGDVLKCLSFLAMNFKYVIAYLMNHEAQEYLFMNMDLTDFNTKAALYQLMGILASECVENRQKFLEMEEEEMKRIIFDAMNSSSEILREKALSFLDSIFEYGTDLHKCISRNDFLEVLVNITMNREEIRCHRSAFSLIGKIVSCEDSHHQCTYFKHGRKKLIREMFLYLKSSILKSDILKELIEALCKIARVNHLYYRVILERGLLDVIGNIIQREYQMEDDLMLTVCSGFECMVQYMEGLDTAVAYKPVVPLCKIILSETRSTELKTAALKALSSIIRNDADLRTTALITIEPQIQVLVAGTEPTAFNHAFLEFLYSSGEELNKLQPVSIYLLIEYLFSLMEFQQERPCNLVFISTIYSTLTCIIKAIPDVVNMLIPSKNDELLIGLLKDQNSDIPFVDTILTYYNMAFSVNVQYIIKMLDTDLVEWLIDNQNLRSVSGNIDRTLNYLLDCDPILKFHFTGELTFTDHIHDGFFAHIYWTPNTDFNKVSNEDDPMMPVLYFNVAGIPKAAPVSNMLRAKDLFTARMKRYLRLGKIKVMIADEINRKIKRSVRKTVNCSRTSLNSIETETVKSVRNVDILKEAGDLIYTEVFQDVSKTSKLPGLIESKINPEQNVHTLAVQTVRNLCSILPFLWATITDSVISDLLNPDLNLSTAVDIVSRNIDDHNTMLGYTDKRTAVKFIAEDVHLMMGKENATNCPKCIKMRAEEILESWEMNFIPLGKVISGSKLERSLLFKLLADRLDIPCSVKRISMYTAWVEVLIEEANGIMNRYIVDLINKIGEVIPANSAEAAKYTNDEYKCIQSCHIFEVKEECPNQMFDTKTYVTEEETVFHESEPTLRRLKK